jgi:hypothetical protein
MRFCIRAMSGHDVVKTGACRLKAATGFGIVLTLEVMVSLTIVLAKENTEWRLTQIIPINSDMPFGILLVNGYVKKARDTYNSDGNMEAGMCLHLQATAVGI